jgi:hypothetical protein
LFMMSKSIEYFQKFAEGLTPGLLTWSPCLVGSFVV